MATFMVIDEEAEGGADVWAYEDAGDARAKLADQIAARQAEGWAVWSHIRHADRCIMENAEGERRTIEMIPVAEGG